MKDSNANIIDQFGRVHDYLRISLTERCNLRCTYCMPEEGIQLRDREEFMTGEELLAIAEKFVELGVKKIRLTGGEPLIKKNIDQIVLGLAKLDVELAITTNGVLLDKHCDMLWDAGIRSINVSLDSLKEDRFNNISRRNYFKRIKQNIDLCIDKGFFVKVNVVVIRGTNDDEIIDFIDWTKTANINIRFIEFMPFEGNKWNWSSKVSFDEIMDQVHSHYGQHAVHKLKDDKNATARNFYVNGAKGSFGIISSVTNPFCDSCNRIRLTADGKIKNCLFSSSETDLLKVYRSGQVDQIKTMIIDSIYKKEKARGGITNFEEIKGEELKNRTMVSIGG